MRTVLAVAAVVTVVTTGVWLLAYRATSAAGDAPRTCSSATLQGSYGFSSTTHYPESAPAHQNSWGSAGANIPSVGRMVFDGQGGWTASYTADPFNAKRMSETKSGKYTVSADCSGSIQAASDKGVTPFVMVTDTAGREVRFMGGYSTGTAFKQDMK